MLCSFKRLLYPSSIEQAEKGEYMIAVYELHENIPDKDGVPVTEAKVVGNYLPTATGLKYDIHGHWDNHKKYGVQYVMESFSEVVEPGRDGTIKYLSCGLIKGIGKKTAERIYDTFGEQTLEVLDKEPDKLLAVSGISKKKLKTIIESYIASRGARNTVAFLLPHGISAKLAVKIYRAFGYNSVALIKENPYLLCQMHEISFDKADHLAMSLGLDPRSDLRLCAGLLQTLKNAERSGHLCLPWNALLREAMSILYVPELTPDMVEAQARELLRQRKMVLYNNYAYRDEIAKMEQTVADCVREQLSFGDKPYPFDLNVEIDKAECKAGITLDALQRKAIISSLKSHISIISGGPGTGKTLIQRFILEIYKAAFPKAKIVCCAPTGRAARRMEQSTGHPASTIHKALSLIYGEDGNYNHPTEIDADLVLVDEVSMLDIKIASLLFSSLRYGTQIVLIGDADQLPSVGPGAVLSELIGCREVPLAMLDNVYRQVSGSRVAVNARRIRHANMQLEYGDDFMLYESPDLQKSAELIEQIYMNEAKVCGIDNVALLTPFRKKTQTGANALNERIREKINPSSHTKPEITYGNRIFRLGDKLMQTQNVEDINNGDVGYNVKTNPAPDEASILVDFGDGRVSEYEKSAFEQLDLAYASTVHKSQGSEYTSVIINLQKCHSVMLKRPLVYTAITRAKERVIIVGERSALCWAINTVDTEKRNTMLGARIIALMHMTKEHQGKEMNHFGTGKKAYGA